MKILVDMDDTIIDLLDAWIQYLNKKYDLSVDPTEVTDWDISNFFPTLSKEEVYEPLALEEFWKLVHPKYDAMAYIQKLHDDGHDIYVVTASDYRTIKVKFDWLIKRYFPCISWNHMIIASQKSMILGDILIDDGVHNLEDGHYQKVLMTAPHNMGYDAEAHGMKRANSWAEAYEYICSLN